MKRLLVLFVVLFPVLFSYTNIAQKMGAWKNGISLNFPEKIQKAVLDPLPEGTYTVGSGGYFPTITSAFDKLSADGVAGPVTLELIDDQYTAPTAQYGYFLNGPIPGTGPSSRVTIRPAANKNVIIEGSNEEVVCCLNTSYVTFDGIGLTGSTTLTIYALFDPQFEWNDCLDFYNNSDLNIIQNIIFVCDDISRWGGGANIWNFFSGSNESPDSNIIQNNYVKKGSVGMGIGANNSPVKAIGNIIRDNIIGSETDSLIDLGILTFYTQNTIIENNMISNLKFVRESMVRGIDIYDGNNDIIRNNVIHNLKSDSGFTCTGILLSGAPGEMGNNNQVYNNMVYDIQSTSTEFNNRVTGIQMWYQNNPRIYYNSVYLSGTGTNKYGSAALYISENCTNVDLKNNILVNTRNESPYCASSIYNYSASNLTTDYNDLYYQPNQYNCLVKIGSTKYNTLADWQVTGKDLNSIFEMPHFIDPYLHINPGVPTNIESHAIPIAGITTDFDGNARNSATPDIGADEFPGIEGINWVAQTLPENDLMIQVKAVDLSTAWALGLHGKVFRTTDGGATWSSVGTSLLIGEGITLCIDAISASTAFVGGLNYDPTIVPPPPADTTFIWRTTDGGATWSAVFAQLHGFIDAVNMISANEGIGLGDPVGGKWTIVHTTDSGATWSRISTEPLQVNNELGYFRSLCTYGTNYIWFGTYIGNNSSGAVYRSTDAGLMWNRVGTPFSDNVYSVCFIDSLRGICGDTSLERSTDGGFTWGPLSGMPSGHWYEDLFPTVSVSAGKDLWAVVDKDVYRSTDLGASWFISYTGTNDTLTHVSFVTVGDNTAGWVTSAGNKIVTCNFYNPTAVHEAVNELIPSEFKLLQNYPNPFNPSTTFRYSIPSESKIIIKVYDILGKEIETLVNEEKPAGIYELTWNAANLPSGVYFYQLRAENYLATKKMLLLK